MRLRTKFLLSLVLVTAGLTCATLLLVRHNAQEREQREIQEDALNVIHTFQIVQHQREVALRRKADLLASMALMRNGDATTIQEVSEDPWQSEDCDLLVLADRNGKIVALHSGTWPFPVATAEELLGRSLKEASTSGWWYSGNRLYQVVLQPFYEDVPEKSPRLGTVIVGRGIDPSSNELRGIPSTQLAFRYGSDVVASTLFAVQEQELTRQLRSAISPKQVQLSDESFLVNSIELTPSAQPRLTLIVLKSYNEAYASLQKLNHLLVGVGFVAVLGGGILVFAISDKFILPLGRLVDGVRALEEGNFTYPLNAQGGDEVAQVTRAFDRMRDTLKKNESDRLVLEGQLRQAQKMEAMGLLAGGVAHDFNNLLTVIKGHTNLMTDRLQPTDPNHRSACQIDNAADRAVSLTGQLLAFCRMQVLQPKVLDLNSLIGEMSSLLKRLIREDIELVFQSDPGCGRVKADPGQIEQVVLNLVVNARDAMPEGGRLTIETRGVKVDDALAKTRPPMASGEYVRLTVADTGRGMDANTKSRIFEPFFTTKEVGKGTGLGLATVYGVVKQSGGCIWVESELGEGTRFEVYLPKVNEPEDRLPKEASPSARHKSETVLLVEDENELRELAALFLRSAGYTVMTARDGQDALMTLENSGAQIHILVTDVVMPNMRGPELAKRLKALRAGLKVVYMSGYLEYNKGNEEFLEEGYFLQKPFTREALVNKVVEALEFETVRMNNPSNKIVTPESP